MKIDIDGAKKRKKERDLAAAEESRKEFEDLKAKMMKQPTESTKKPFDYAIAKQNASVLTEDDQFERAEGEIESQEEEEEEKEEKYIEDFYGNKSDGP